MAEQNSRDVVDQTLSGGEPSPSDVPASTTDKPTPQGDVGEIQHIATSSTTQSSTDPHYNDETRQTPVSHAESTGTDKETGSPSMVGLTAEGRGGSLLNQIQDSSKQSIGLVASRAIELNGLASVSDGGDDTASQGGSESDASRTDGRHHARTGSVKKPSTFKPVSFAKFAVPKAPGTAAPPKAPEKVPSTSTTPLGTPQPSSRPRLVAKATSGNSVLKPGSSNSNLGGSGPDPNQVWNKNRPVQPTPAKHLTDEELKQQYGIHMTSRIQEDGGGTTEAKWADIDDDEDDWAPETIEWTDGTKVTLTHTDPVPAPEHAHGELSQPPPPPPLEATETKEPPKIAAPKPTTSIGPNPTVLRLGANAERQAKAASISSKGTNDRAPSGSTSPAPPVKSPWASLPPVERVSPVNASGHPPPPRPPPHYPHRDDLRHAAYPPQEIAADDFNRQWRESAPGAPRELFNSRSGRYEPVSDNRRPSWRNEPPSGGARGPAVLQRSGQDHGGPAEPSAAFQTHRHHQEGGGGMGWNRRRTSSNVSGGSGGYGRRMSFGRADGPPRHFEARRGSQTNGMIDPALIDRDQIHPHATAHQHGSSAIASPPSPTAAEIASTENQPAPSTAPAEPEEDPLVMQARVMKETIRLAKQRREEQEEQEKLARQERIRQKLASLPPAPEKPQRKESVESRKPQAPPTPSAAPAVMHSPPKPPVPEPTGAPKQYGMMKVHHPDTVKKLVAANERDRVSEKHTDKPPSSHLRQANSPREAKREPVQATEQKQQPQQQQPAQSPPQDTNVDEQSGQWRGNLNVPGSYPSWSANPKLASTSPSVKNPWKPLSSDRTLGNGIFDQPLGGFPSRELPLRSQLALDQPAQALPGAQDVSVIASLPSPETRIAGYDPLSPIGRPGPIGPPSLPRNPNALGAWGNFHNVASHREAEESEQKRQEFNANRNQPSTAVNFNETWKQVRSGEEAGQRHVMGGGVNQNHQSLPVNPLTGLDAPVDGLPFSETHARPLVSVPTRSSRFFPHGPEQPKKTATVTTTVIEKHDYERSPSPPPPEESSHPVYFGGSGRPLVHLPTPKPVVKLPPKAIAAPPPPPPTFASMAAAPPQGAPAPSSKISWQEKINTLFGKKTPPATKSSLAVTSATKEPLDVQLPPAAAVSVSVSFPTKVVDTRGGDGDLAVRQVEEQDEIFEDREPGSQPPVRVPNMAPAAAWAAAQPPPPTRQRGKLMKPVQSRSVEPYIVGLGEKDTSGNLRVLIRFPGALASKICSLPKKISASRPRASPPVKPRKGPKPRDASGNAIPPKKSSPQSGGTSSTPRHSSQKATWGPRAGSGSR
ncbi:unnamed protein product [Penicillium pancosmium]